MKIIHRTAWLLAISLAISAGAKPTLDCYGSGGGGGPGPFIDITGSLVSHKRTINTGGSVQDFLYLQNRDSLISRTENGDLMSTDLGGNEPFRIGHMDMALSRILHPSERFLVSDGSTYLFDMNTGGWKHFLGPSGPIEHLFWFTPPGLKFRPSLFSLGAPTRLANSFEYRLYELNPQYDRVTYCSIELPTEYRIVRGMTQPYVVFFKDERAGKGREITFRLYRTRARIGQSDCILAQEGALRLPDMPAAIPLEGAYFLAQQGAAALKFDHPRKNLVWVKWRDLNPVDKTETRDAANDPDGCKFYSVDNAQPIFLSEHEPIMASWGGSRSGLQLYYLNKGKKARLLGDVSLTDVDARSLWLSRDGEKLFVSPQTKYGGREVIEMSLRAP